MNLKTRATRAFGSAVLSTRKNSPHIFFGVGIVGFVGTVVLASRATLKLEPTLDEITADIESVKANAGPSDQENGRNLFYAYSRAGVSLGKLYGPAVVVGVASIGFLTKSHVQLSKRNAALAASYAAVTQAFDEYRDRVRAELGDDKERDIYLGVEDVEIEEDGKKKKVKGIKGTPSIHARFFDQFNANWTKDPEQNRYFLQAQQNYWNHRLHAYGYVFLNEVYESLGMERSQIGQLVGWRITDDGTGDGYIDFGLYEETNNARFINNLEWSALLDFNVDRGVIYDKI